VIAKHASDNSLVTLDNPAHAGESIIAYGNDIFTVWPEAPVGIPAPAGSLIANVPGSFDYLLYLQSYPGCFTPPITGGVTKCPTSTPPLQTAFLGMAPGQVGLQQVTFTVPPNQEQGDWALFFNNTFYQTPDVLLPVR
jgi:hypothetical protein